MINFSNFKSIISVINYFNEEDICKKALVEARWGDDVVCPYCGQHHCATRKDGKFRFEDMFKRAAKSFDYTDVLALSSVVSIEHFREYRIMYYNFWKSTHCA